MTTPTTSRARFEEWINAEPFSRSIYRNSEDATKSAWPGQYRDITVEIAWLAHQHAEAGNRECVEALRGLVSKIDRDEIESVELIEIALIEARRVLAGLKENEG